MQRAYPKTNFASEKSVLMVDFIWEIQIQISWISFSPFNWEIRKMICKTILMKSGLLFAIYVSVCKTTVLKNCFSNPFFRFPKEKERKAIQEQISQSWKPFADFVFDCKSEIWILKSKSRFPNQMYPWLTRMRGMTGDIRLTRMTGTTEVTRDTEMTGVTRVTWMNKMIGMAGTTGLAWMNRMNRMTGISWMSSKSKMTWSLMRENLKKIWYFKGGRQWDLENCVYLWKNSKQNKL